MIPNLEKIKPACGLITTSEDRGTGYLIDKRRVVTCAHVVSAKGVIKVQFPSRGYEGSVTEFNEDADTAVVTLTEDAVGIDPLRFAATLPGSDWLAYGFPSLSEDIGLPLFGTIQDPNGMDVRHQPALLLFSKEAAAGQGPPLGGFSGSPVLVDGQVVGHLKRVISSEDRPSRPELGYLFATPNADILRVLGQVAAPAITQTKVEPVSAATLAADEFHVSLAYNSRWIAWGKTLLEHLEGYGLRVFVDQSQTDPGDDCEAALRSGMEHSHASVLLLTRAWLDSPWCQSQATLLLKRLAEHPSFQIVPLLMEDLKLPVGWEKIDYIDFRGHSRPGGAALNSLLYKLLGGSVPSPDSPEGKVGTDRQRFIELMIQRIDAEAITAQRLYNFWRELAKAGTPDVPVTLHAANCLISLGEPTLALELLDSGGNGIRVRQLRALAKAKNGALEDAIADLACLEAEDHLDAETGGLLAGRYRQMAERTHNGPLLAQARDLYARYFRMTGDTYCGINAATMALQDNNRAEATKTAISLIDILGQSSDDALTHWDCATLGDASFIIGDSAKGRYWYGEAAQKAATFDQDRARMRRYARPMLTRLGLADDLLDDVLQVPQPVGFFGHTMDAPGRQVKRFSSDMVPAVRASIRDKLEKLKVNRGASCASDGGDLLFLTELLKRGGQAMMVLPTSLEAFEKKYLTGNWVARFREVVANPNIRVRVAEPQPGEDVWDACRRVIRVVTTEWATMLDRPTLLLAVWDGNSETYVKSAIDLWNEEGDSVEQIPLPK